jgi:hypothetical protein
MRIPRAQSPPGGYSIMLALFVTAAVSLAVVSYMNYASTQHTLSRRSQSWNLALGAAEAGVEEAMSQLSYLTYYPDSSVSDNGWVVPAANVLRKRRDLTPDSYFQVEIQQGNPAVVTSRGYFKAPASGEYVQRTLQVTMGVDNAVLGFAALARKHVKVANGGIIDSFDSGSALYSTDGKYDPTKNKANAKVGATGPKDKGEVKVDKGKIYGEAHVGKKGKIKIKKDAGWIGDKAWCTGGGKGLQPGHGFTGLKMNFPDVEEPFKTGVTPIKSKFKYSDGKEYCYHLTTGNYLVNTIEFKDKPILVTGNAVLYVTGKLYAEQDFVIKPGASLKIYVGGEAKFKNDFQNQTGLASQCQIFGVRKCKSIKIEKGAELTALIYAPKSRVEIKGAGDVIGTVVGKCVHLKQGGSLHYDEALSRLPLGTHKYVVQAWAEI